MLLNEFIYFNDNEDEMTDKGRYDPEKDTSVIKSTDLRKSRLTLRMLNDLRKELELVRKMYAAPKPEGAM
jgi:hypothetical protein